MSEAMKRAMLRKAVERIGLEDLAARIGSPAPLVGAWMVGQASMPERKFLALVDLLETLGDTPEADK